MWLLIQTLRNTAIELPSTFNDVVLRIETPCYWLDLKRRSEGSRDFTWSDGSSFEGLMDLFQLEDNFSSSNDDCVCVFRRSGRFFARTLSCTAKASFVCRRKGTETTGSGKRGIL